MESNIDGRASEMQTRLREALKDSEKELNERKKCKAAVARCEDKIQFLQERVEDLQKKIDSINEQISESLSEDDGRDLEGIFKEKRTLEAELEDKQSMIRELKGKILPQAKNRLSPAQHTVNIVLSSLVGMVGSDYQSELNKKVKDLIEIDLFAWEKAVNNFCKDMEVSYINRPLRIESHKIKKMFE